MTACTGAGLTQQLPGDTQPAGETYFKGIINHCQRVKGGWDVTESLFLSPGLLKLPIPLPCLHMRGFPAQGSPGLRFILRIQELWVVS